MSRIAIFSSDQQIRRRLEGQLTELSREWPEPLGVKTYSRFAEFLDSGKKNPRRIMLLAQEGAASVDLAAAVAEECPENPLVWLSDLDFALFSYRLEADYFGLLPGTTDSLRAALRNCGHRKRIRCSDSKAETGCSEVVQTPRVDDTLRKKLAAFFGLSL